MCSSNPVEAIATVATGGAAQAYFGAKRSIDKQVNLAADAQKNAMEVQARRDAEAKAQAEAVGPAARKFDQVNQNAIEEEKRRMLALQNGIAGTITNKPGLVSTPAPGTEIKKATLGA